MDIFEKLTEIFSCANAKFRVIEHIPEGRSDQIAKIRGNELHQSAKAPKIKKKVSTMR